MNRLFSCLLLSLGMVPWNGIPGAAGAETAPPVSVQYSLEKEYGYFIGDVVKVSYTLALPPDRYLKEDSLPGEGPHGEWIEVRTRKVSENGTRDLRTYNIEMTYQVFFASDTAQSFEIPGVEFLYGTRNGPLDRSLQWGAVPITISPLTSPVDEFQPPIPWSWKSSTPQIIRNAGVLLLLGGIGAAAFLFRGKARSRSPLGDGLKRLSREKDPRAALILFRNVLNEKAGQAIFPTNMEELFRVFPKARACEKELRNLVVLSDEMSFNPKSFKAGNGLLRNIAETMKKMKRLERWA